MKKYIGILLLSLFAAVACEDQFNVSDTSYLNSSQTAKLVEDDPDFLSSYIAGFYTTMIDQCAVSDSHDEIGFIGVLMTLDFMGQDIAMAGGQHFGVYNYQHDYNAENYSRPLYYWSLFYTLINNANAVIDFFSADADPTDVNARGYLGQAYAVRAMSYYYLINIFQDPIALDGSLNLEAPGVPVIYANRDMVTSEVKEAHSGRTAIGEILPVIESDFDKAIALLDGYHRSSKNEIDLNVAKGLAARYHLFAQHWAKAAELAQSIIDSAEYDLMDEARLNAGFADYGDNEMMWGFDYTADTYGMYASFGSHMNNEKDGYASIMYKCIDARLYAAMSESDYRRSLFNGPDGDPSAPSTAAAYPYASRKFKDPNGDWMEDALYMRNSEFYLIAAEAYARESDSRASAVFSEFMSHRDPSYSAPATVENILLQRRIEFWGEGFEFFDLRRLGLGITRIYDGTNHAVFGRTDYPAHDKAWTYQIPLREIQNNMYISDSEQNEL